jgi:hypothetical protein
MSLARDNRETCDLARQANFSVHRRKILPAGSASPKSALTIKRTIRCTKRYFMLDRNRICFCEWLWHAGCFWVTDDACMDL